MPLILTPHAHEILPRFWVGDQEAARLAALDSAIQWQILCVLEGPTAPPEIETHIRIRDDNGTAKKLWLEDAALWIQTRWPQKTILVHCGAGVERSPLTTVWYMCTRMSLTLDEAYAWVKARRDVIWDRRSWLEELPR